MKKQAIQENSVVYSKAIWQPLSIDEKNFEIDFIMSAQIEDRQGDIVDLPTMNTDEYMNNPVVIPAHDYDKKAVGQVISIKKEMINGVYCLVGRVKFAAKETQEAKEYWNLYSKGYQRAVSIGFRVNRFLHDEETDVYTLLDCVLLELSLVAVPANQLALAKSAGIEVSAIVKSMPRDVLLKSINESLLGIKELVEDKTEELEDEENQDKNDTPDDTQEDEKLDSPEEKNILKKEDSLARANRIMAKAIRQLKV